MTTFIDPWGSIWIQHRSNQLPVIDPLKIYAYIFYNRFVKPDLRIFAIASPFLHDEYFLLHDKFASFCYMDSFPIVIFIKAQE